VLVHLAKNIASPEFCIKINILSLLNLYFCRPYVVYLRYNLLPIYVSLIIAKNCFAFVKQLDGRTSYSRGRGDAIILATAVDTAKRSRELRL